MFFARIMKEHSLFLMAGFPCVNTEWIRKADLFRQQFEELLREVVRLSNGKVGTGILESQELVTEFTIPAERRTEQLSGVTIDSGITERTKNLDAWGQIRFDREIFRTVHNINQRALRLVEDLISFKQSILNEVRMGTLFTANYPLLIEHIMREAKLYATTIKELLDNRELSYKNIRKTEIFWNQIMMEHALFIRGLLDPCEVGLIETADQFAVDYKELVEQARRQDCRAMRMTEESLKMTCAYRDFKAAGTEGILSCKIDSIILPLLADHVLREANHYIRLLEAADDN